MTDVAELISHFVHEETLGSDSQSKTVSYLGTIDGKPALLRLEKAHFDPETAYRSLEVSPLASNDVYHWGTTPEGKFNLVYPASEKHIAKWQSHPTHMVVETPEAYETVVKPYVQTQLGDRIQWVRNILYEGAEAERIVFKNEDYLVLPDMKWDGTTMEALYLVCLTYRPVTCIRDFTAADIPWLEKLQESLLTEVPKKYPHVSRDTLRMYVHYQPSFYHFHIHVVNAAYVGVGHTILAGKAILLGEVVETLRLLGQLGKGMADKTITYEMSESHDLWEGLKAYSQ